MARSKVRLILISQALFVHSLPIPITEPRGAVLKLIIYNPRAWMWELFSGERDVMCHPYKHPEREFIISHCEFRIANLSPNGSIQLSKRWRVTSIGGTPKIKLFIIQLQCITMLPLFPNSSSVSGGGFYNKSKECNMYSLETVLVQVNVKWNYGVWITHIGKKRRGGWSFPCWLSHYSKTVLWIN